jgi:hypothetical protein
MFAMNTERIWFMESLLCGAHSRSTQQPCKNIAGKGTDHIGQGRCRLHGGASPIKTGLYSKIQRHRIGQRMAEIAESNDLLELHQELAMMKALLEELVERDQAGNEALRAWHRTTTPAFQTLLESNVASQIRESIFTLRAAEASRPTEFPDVVRVAMLVDRIGRTVERIHKTAAICTRDQLNSILEQMGAIVAEHVDDETNQKIREGWNNITLEGRR